MNFKQIICEAAGKNWGWCDYYWDTVLVCKETNLLAVPDCPLKEERRLLKRDVPATACAAHKPVVPPAPTIKLCAGTLLLASRWCETTIDWPEAQAPPLICRKHRPARFAKVPYMVLFVVDLISAAHLFSDEELDASFAKPLGAAGCDFVRALLCWKRPGGREYTLPFKRVNGLADWDQPNPEWDKQAARIQRILGKYGVGIYLDLFAQQYDRADYGWSPFRYNVNGLKSWRDTTPAAMKRWEQLVDRGAKVIGIEGNWLGFGNELIHPDDYLGDTVPQDNWAKAWVVPLGNYMRSIGIPPPNPFSASGNMQGTGHSLYNRLVKQAGWAMRDTFWVLHGCAISEQFDSYTTATQRLSYEKNYGISDDGVGLGGNIVPVEKQGLTQGWDGRRSSHLTWKVEMVRHVQEQLGNRFRLVEVMPFSLKRDDWTPSMLHQEEEVDVFWRIAKEVYGKDIRREI